MGECKEGYTKDAAIDFTPMQRSLAEASEDKRC